MPSLPLDADRAAVTTGPVAHACVLGQQRACPRQPPRDWLGARASPLLAPPSWCHRLRLGFSGSCADIARGTQKAKGVQAA
eukprot:scaffold83275_cov30-Phaeocystis_antarctica.AAC.1